MAISLATLVGAVFGTALFNVLALFVTKAWPMSISKLLIVGVAMFLLLALGDNAVRDQEPMGVTFIRVGIAQIIVTLCLIVGRTLRSQTRT